MITIKQQIESLKNQIAPEMREHSAFMHVLEKYDKEFIDENDRSKTVTVSEDGKSIIISCKKEQPEGTNGLYKGIYELNVHSITIAPNGILLYDKKRVAELGFKHQNDSNGVPISDQADFEHSIAIYDDKNQILKKARYIVQRKIDDWKNKSYSHLEQYPKLTINNNFDIVFPEEISEYERRESISRDADGYFERGIECTFGENPSWYQCGYSNPENWELYPIEYLETYERNAEFYDEYGNKVEDTKAFFLPFPKTPGLN